MGIEFSPLKWIKNLFIFIFAILFAIVGMTLFILTYSVFSIFGAIYKKLIIIIARFKIPDGKILRPLDGIMSACGDIYRATHNYLTLTMIFEGEGDIETFRELWTERILRKRYPNGKLQFPQMQQFVQKFAGYNFWLLDKYFDIKNYIFLHQENSANKEMVDKERLIEIRADFQKRLFPKTHGLWEILMVNNYQHNNSDKKHFALVCKFHHTIGDGLAMMKLMWYHLLQFPMEKPKKTVNRKSSLSIYCNSVLRSLVLPFSVAKILYKYPFDFVYNPDRFFDNNSWHTHIKKEERKYELWVPEPLSKSAFNEIKTVVGVSTMSILVTAIVGGIRRMMVEKELPLPKYMRTSYPIPLPNHPDYLVNHARMVEFLAPVANPSAKERLLKTHKNIQTSLAGPFPIVLGMFTWMAGNLPYKFHRVSSDYRLCSLCIPCTPLPRGDVDLLGCPLVSAYCIFYTTQADCGTTVSVIGHNDHFYTSLQIEQTLLKNPNEVKNFEKYIVEELNALKKDILCVDSVV